MKKYFLILPILILTACSSINPVAINQGDPKIDLWKQLDFKCNVFAGLLETITIRSKAKSFTKVEKKKMLNSARIIAPLCSDNAIILDIKYVLKIIEKELTYLIIMRGMKI